MLASSVECTIGQRLVRRICTHCKEKVSIDKEVAEFVKKVLESVEENPKVEAPKEYEFYKGKGCSHCNGLGYKGRVAIYEVVEMTPHIQKFIQQEGVTNDEIEKEAIKQGSLTMIQDGVLRATEGLTTMDEVLRVIR